METISHRDRLYLVDERARRRPFCAPYKNGLELHATGPGPVFFAALIDAHPIRVEEVRRSPPKAAGWPLVRPMDALGNYPLQPKYEPVWDALEEPAWSTACTVPAFGTLKPSGYSEQYSGAELIRRRIATAGLPHSFLSNVQNFQAERRLGDCGPDVRLFDRHPKINAAVFEASSTCSVSDRRMRQGLSALSQQRQLRH